MTEHARYSDHMPADRLAPSGSPWTAWLYPLGKGPATMLVTGQACTLYGVQGCAYNGCSNGLPLFAVPGHGVQALTQEQAASQRIHTMSEHEAGTGGVKRADPR